MLRRRDESQTYFPPFSILFCLCLLIRAYTLPFFMPGLRAGGGGAYMKGILGVPGGGGRGGED